MLHFLDPLRTLDFLPLTFRLFMALVCGTLIGLERSAKNRPAGFRTHILVCLSGAVAAVTGHYLYLGLGLPADITRLSGQVITGLGFIGAGTIIVTKNMTIKGLTTAAGLWTTGIIGLAIGSGFYEGGLLGTILLLTAEVLFAKYPKASAFKSKLMIEILYNDRDALDHVLHYFEERHASVRNLQIHSENRGNAKYAAVIAVRDYGDKSLMIDEIRDLPGVVSAAEL